MTPLYISRLTLNSLSCLTNLASQPWSSLMVPSRIHLTWRRSIRPETLWGAVVGLPVATDLHIIQKGQLILIIIHSCASLKNLKTRNRMIVIWLKFWQLRVWGSWTDSFLFSPSSSTSRSSRISVLSIWDKTTLQKSTWEWSRTCLN